MSTTMIGYVVVHVVTGQYATAIPIYQTTTTINIPYHNVPSTISFDGDNLIVTDSVIDSNQGVMIDDYLKAVSDTAEHRMRDYFNIRGDIIKQIEIIGQKCDMKSTLDKIERLGSVMQNHIKELRKLVDDLQTKEIEYVESTNTTKYIMAPLGVCKVGSATMMWCPAGVPNQPVVLMTNTRKTKPIPPKNLKYIVNNVNNFLVSQANK